MLRAKFTLICASIVIISLGQVWVVVSGRTEAIIARSVVGLSVRPQKKTTTTRRACIELTSLIWTFFSHSLERGIDIALTYYRIRRIHSVTVVLTIWRVKIRPVWYICKRACIASRVCLWSRLGSDWSRGCCGLNSSVIWLYWNARTVVVLRLISWRCRRSTTSFHSFQIDLVCLTESCVT